MYRNVFLKCTFTYELLQKVGLSISLIIFPLISSAFPPSSGDKHFIWTVKVAVCICVDGLSSLC